MTCCNNSEQIRFENLLKEGCEYKSEKKINIRHSNKHLQNKWNSARFRFQKILGPEPIKYVAKYWLSQRRRTWCTTWWPHPTESAACQCTGRPPQINPTRLKEKTRCMMVPLNHMHRGHCSQFTILKVAAVSWTTTTIGVNHYSAFPAQLVIWPDYLD